MNKEINEMVKDISALQVEYQRLIEKRQLTKKAMCDLVIPFRDKYKLTDKVALMCARNEITFQELAIILEGGQLPQWKI